MPGDTPGNPGVLCLEPGDAPEYAEEELAAAEGDDFAPAEGAPLTGDRVRGMQVQAAPLAAGLPRQFGDLWNLICDFDFLARSWDRVRSNRGARTSPGSTACGP